MFETDSSPAPKEVEEKPKCNNNNNSKQNNPWLSSCQVSRSQQCTGFAFFLFSFQGHTFSIWKFPGLGVELELQLLTDATATATTDLSHICNLDRSRILNPLSEVRDQTHILKDTSQVLNPRSHNGNSCTGFSESDFHDWLLMALAFHTALCCNSSY